MQYVPLWHDFPMVFWECCDAGLGWGDRTGIGDGIAHWRGGMGDRTQGH